jgi:hypothetical protein
MKKKAKREFDEATRASVEEEMAKPRMARSVREEEGARVAGRMVPAKRGMAKLKLHLPSLLRRTR